MTTTPAEQAVLDVADTIVAAYASTDTKAYFAGFDDNASFVFHSEENRLNSRAEYERLWDEWVQSGWRVVSCTSSNRLVQVFPGGAVFSHTVETVIDSSDGPDAYTERESMVFRTEGEGSLIAIHEHLSSALSAAAGS